MLNMVIVLVSVSIQGNDLKYLQNSRAQLSVGAYLGWLHFSKQQNYK